MEQKCSFPCWQQPSLFSIRSVCSCILHPTMRVTRSAHPILLESSTQTMLRLGRSWPTTKIWTLRYVPRHFGYCQDVVHSPVCSDARRVLFTSRLSNCEPTARAACPPHAGSYMQTFSCQFLTDDRASPRKSPRHMEWAQTTNIKISVGRSIHFHRPSHKHRHYGCIKKPFGLHNNREHAVRGKCAAYARTHTHPQKSTI
jgi:hypothetical protein